MNTRMILRITGRILILEAALMLLPCAVGFFNHEPSAWMFVKSILITLAVGLGLALIRPVHRTFYAKEGFAIVALSWITMSICGALPFYFSGEIPHFVDAFFETVSGFTTTGASILPQVESLSKGILFWRSFTHWIGGMGVLVLMMVISPAGSNSMHLLRAEMPGPIVEKLMPKFRDTAKILYGIYFVLTAVEVVLLLFGGMDLYDSLVHSFGTAGTGGFSVRNASIAAYNSVYIDVVITVFMLLFGINFAVYYLMLMKKFGRAFKNNEVRLYLGIVAVSIAIVTVNILPLYDGVGDALRHASFQVASIITTTGYATADFNLWPQTARTVLMLLMVCGACAGSTGGGLKVGRILVLWRALKRELNHMLHPNAVRVVQVDGKAVEEETISGISLFFFLYMLVAGATLLLLTVDGFDMETNLTAMLACLNNIGPGLGMVGPTGNFSAFSNFSKILLSANMLLGRLELYPMVLLLMSAARTRGHEKKGYPEQSAV